MDFNGKDVLGVHVQGDKTFSMYKQWGQGDERLIPIYPIYEDTIIRWGKEEVIQALFEHNDNNLSKVSTRKEEFLY
jgi:hypothetical protein